MLSQNGNPLLEYAISRLNPQVFLHPIWVRFGKQEISALPNTINDLLSAARNLQDEDPSVACQVLLVCAAYQNHIGQRYDALKTNQQALSLAERTGLAQETIWAIWGVCAISIQQGNYEQAASYLIDLHAALNKQNEWVLADFIEVLKQSFSHPITVSAPNPPSTAHNRPLGDLLAFTFNWLQHWGFSVQVVGAELESTPRGSISPIIQSPFSFRHWWGHWHSLILAFRGELKLQWTENEGPGINRRFAFWGSILSSLRLYLSGRKIHPQGIDDIHPTTGPSLLPTVTESFVAKVVSDKRKLSSTDPKVDVIHLSGQAVTFIPVSIQMLGTFSITIENLTLKLSSSRGLSLFKYLILHHKQSIPREVLMDIFWSDAEPETARNSLNVALHSLRRALGNVMDFPVILFEDGAYHLASNLHVWLDVEEFERCVRAGQRLEARDHFTAALAEYESAISLYQGDFLEQNPYEEWTVLDRERLRMAYLDTLDRLSRIYFNQERYAACITVCQLILSRDRCREDAHCLLMRCYSRQGQHHLAVRQFQICVTALRTELDVEPTLETTQLHRQIRRQEHV